MFADQVLHLKSYSTKHLVEAAIVAGGLATMERFSTMDKAVPEDTHEATPEAGNDPVESETTLNIEPQQEHQVDATAPEAEDTHPDMDSSLQNDPTPDLLPLEPDSNLIETELLAESQIGTSSTAATKSVPIDAEVQSDSGLSENAPSAQKDIEVETQVDDTNIKDVPTSELDDVQHIEVADNELDRLPEEAPAKESQNAVQLESGVDFVAPTEEKSSAIAQSEGLLPKIESEAIPDLTASETNVEDHIIAPVDIRSDHAAVVEISSTDEPAEVVLPPNVKESPETLTTLVEPLHKSEDDEIVRVSVFPILMHR